MSHVHASGRLERYQEYLDRLGANAAERRTTRGPLEVRVYGDAAVMTGRLTFDMTPADGSEAMHIEGVATQVWVRVRGEWRQTAFHLTRL